MDGGSVEKLKRLFPLKDIDSVVVLFEDQIKSSDTNLTVPSLVCGFLEYNFTNKANKNPLVEIIGKANSHGIGETSSRSTVKVIADFVWGQLPTISRIDLICRAFTAF